MTDVLAYARRCFHGATTDRIGVELEFPVFDRAAPNRTVPIERIRAALPRLPGGSRVTFEPGGQLELSSPPGPFPGVIADLTADVHVARRALREAGLVLGATALDLVRPPVRQLHEPRYDAMAAFLGEPYGPLMMCSTASIQVNLDIGDEPAVRWERAHLLGPALVAAFANSPAAGWASARQAIWSHLDPTRTAPVPASGDPVADWARYLSHARLMMVRTRDGGLVPVLDGSRFRGFAAVAGRPPSGRDLAYHATTLFPPVRPRGWLEIRYLDAQPPAAWPVCAAVVYALITDDRAAARALEHAAPVSHRWLDAARSGLADPELHRAAAACFHAAIDALPRLGAGRRLIDRVTAFAAARLDRAPAAAPTEEVLA